MGLKKFTLIKFGSTIFFVPKIFEKNFGSKKIWVQKNFGSEKMLVQKNWVPKYCLVGKNSGSKKIVGPKKI